jgi:hypothetical protein
MATPSARGRLAFPETGAGRVPGEKFELGVGLVHRPRISDHTIPGCAWSLFPLQPCVLTLQMLVFIQFPGITFSNNSPVAVLDQTTAF